MSAIYDNWERLVAAVIKKQQLWELFHEQSRSPSILSDASSVSRDSSPHQLLRLSDFIPPVDIEHVVGGVSTELLGRGTFGSAYVATINDVKRFVVKSVEISQVDFKRVLEVVGDVSHENVVALRAYSSSSSSPHKLLLYDYYSNGSVGYQGGSPRHLFSPLAERAQQLQQSSSNAGAAAPAAQQQREQWWRRSSSAAMVTTQQLPRVAGSDLSYASAPASQHGS